MTVGLGSMTVGLGSMTVFGPSMILILTSASIFRGVSLIHCEAKVTASSVPTSINFLSKLLGLTWAELWH